MKIMTTPIKQMREAVETCLYALAGKMPNPVAINQMTTQLTTALTPLVEGLVKERDGANEILDAVIVGFDRALSRIIANDPVGAERELKLALAQMDNPTKTGESVAQLRTRAEQAEKELAEVRIENTRIRAALAVSKDPCIYCQLPAADIGKCAAGFPGCARADDISGCPEFGAAMQLHDVEAKLATLRADKERLDWLEAMSPEANIYVRKVIGQREETLYGWRTSRLRELIDAARATPEAKET